MLRRVTTPHGAAYQCCTTHFHGQTCPDCRKFYESPNEHLEDPSNSELPTEAPEPAREEDEVPPGSAAGEESQEEAPEAPEDTAPGEVEGKAPRRPRKLKPKVEAPEE